MPINHLVLSGGAYLGFAELGALEILQLDTSQIETYDATSIGAIFSVLLALGCPIEDIKEYFVERPWEQVIHEMYPSFSMRLVKDSIEQGGFFDIEFIRIVMIPFLSIHFPEYTEDFNQLTLRQLYEYTKKDIYMYTVRLPKDTIDIELLSISHHTHPDLPLFVALQMTTAVPVLFKPVKYNDDYYVDGGLLSNYPLEQCLERGINQDNVFSIYLKTISSQEVYGKYMLFEFQYSLLYRTIFHIRKKYENKSIQNELIILCEHATLQEGYNQIKSREARETMVESGKKHAILFQEYQERKRTLLPTNHP